MSQALLAAIVFVAFGTEAAMGFGCNVLAVTLAIHLYPLDQLLPVLVSLNLVVSIYIVVRHRDAIVWPLLRRRILPLMAIGMPVGMLMLFLGSGPALKLGFGLFVIALSALELARVLGSRASTRGTAAARPLGLPASVVILTLGGLMHGLYASGGPMAVYFASRELPDKRRFRSTLSLLWLVLNVILIVGYLFRGLVDQRVAQHVGILIFPLALGILAGEWLHNRVDAWTFRLLVFALLLAGGIVLVVMT